MNEPRALPALDDEELRVAAGAGDPVSVRHRAGGERGDERAVAVRVAHVDAPRARVVRTRRFRGEIRCREIRARVDHGNPQSGGGAQDRRRHGVAVDDAVLPLPHCARRHRREGEPGLRDGEARRRPLYEADPRRAAQRQGDTARSRRANLGHVQGRKPSHDDRRRRAKRRRERLLALVADREPHRDVSGSRACGTAAARRGREHDSPQDGRDPYRSYPPHTPHIQRTDRTPDPPDGEGRSAYLCKP